MKTEDDKCLSCSTGQALRRRARFFEEIIDCAPSMVRRMDAKGGIEYVNPAAAEALGQSADAMTGKLLTDLVTADERDQILQNMARLQVEKRYDLKRAGGEIEEWNDFSITGEDGNVISFISFGHNVTKERQKESNKTEELKALNRNLKSALEDARRSRRAKDVFLAEMSHDLRTPLNAISGFAQAIQSGLFERDPQKVKEYAAFIHESAGTLTQMVSNVLELSHIESRDVSEHREIFDLTPVLARVLREVQPSLKTDVTLRPLTFKDEVHISGDPDQIGRAFANLLSNSAKFTAKGWIGVDVERRGDCVHVWVKDTGCGVEPEEVERLLRPFENDAHDRRPHTAKKPGQGYGLGLPLARRFVELHEGRFAFRSKPGVGTVVEVQLPLLANQKKRSSATMGT